MALKVSEMHFEPDAEGGYAHAGTYYRRGKEAPAEMSVLVFTMHDIADDTYYLAFDNDLAGGNAAPEPANTPWSLSEIENLFASGQCSQVPFVKDASGTICIGPVSEEQADIIHQLAEISAHMRRIEQLGETTGDEYRKILIMKNACTRSFFEDSEQEIDCSPRVLGAAARGGLCREMGGGTLISALG